MPRKPFLAVIAAALAAASLGLSACGSDDDSSAADTETPAASTSAPAATTAPTDTAGSAAGAVQLEADPSGQLAFVQKTLSAPAGSVTVELTNASPVPHNVAVEGNGVESPPSETISGGQTAELTVDLQPGDYTFYCEVPGHEAAGMKGTLTVQ